MELELLKIKSYLGRRNPDQNSASQTNPQLNRTMPVTKDDFLREVKLFIYYCYCWWQFQGQCVNFYKLTYDKKNKQKNGHLACLRW